jgi:hypothetical protein
MVTFNDQSEAYNGVDLTINARLPHNTLLAGGLNTGRTAYNNCTNPAGTSAMPTFPVSRIAVANNSHTLCELTPPFVTQIKVLGAYTIPRVDTQLSATLQNLPGPQILATWAAPSAAIAPSLGRPLAGNAATSTIQLLAPATYFGDRLNQIDFRVSKSLRLPHGRRLQVNVDLYNAMNANPVTQENGTFGPQWRTPTSILAARLLKFGAQLEF